MRARTLSSASLLLIAASAIAYGGITACGSDSFSGSDTDGGSVSGNGCDPTQDPSQNQCVVKDDLGVFVDANSDPTSGDGSRAHPFAKLQAGIDAAKTAQKRVYVCVGTYAEQITLANGVSIFGNLDCTDNWTVVSNHAAVKAPSSPAVLADQIQTATRIDSLDMIAPDASATAPNSVALLVTGSPALTVANAVIHAGHGLDGVDGTEGIQLKQVGGVNGGASSAGGVTGGNCLVFPHPPLCDQNPAPGGTSICSAPEDAGVDAAAYNGGSGGAGGTGGICTLTACSIGPTHIAGECCSGTPANGAAAATTPTTAKGAVVQVADAVAGSLGAAATGTNGTNGSGHWDGTTYVAGTGTSGANGVPGQGGGGGAGGNPTYLGTGDVGGSARGPGGAGGGAGGCPGLAGTGGTGGGASIAVVASDSPFTLDTCTLQSSAGGKAGKGTFGSEPTTGGSGGTTNTNDDSNNYGAAGSTGGAAGWSGNGSAGPSYAIATHGAQPVLTNTMQQPGKGGTGVAAQTSLAKTIPATPDGESANATTF